VKIVIPGGSGQETNCRPSPLAAKAGIHAEDFVRAIQWLIEHDDIDGVVNAAAPHPLPNADFMRMLREAAGVRIHLSPTKLMLEPHASGRSARQAAEEHIVDVPLT